MSQPATTPTTSPANGQTSPHDLFVLTDEQILEIEPEPQDLQVKVSENLDRSVIPSDAGTLSSTEMGSATERSKRASPSLAASRSGSANAQGAMQDVEPPRWLAEMMADPQAGGEACDFWNGIQQARSDANAYREVFARPEDARAAAERARALDEFDAAFYGRAGNSPEQTSVARTQLAQRMMREDPAAFREMVFAGLRALEGPENAPPAASRSGATQSTPQNNPSYGEQFAAYRAFEHSANQELERTVGGAIERALGQALPNLKSREEAADSGVRHAVPLQERLGAAIREDVEASLKGDRQLGEQVAQILSFHRFDDEARAQVVRLINNRAQQLIPSAAKRVINAWTQTTFAAHGARLPEGQAKTPKAASAGERPDLAPARSTGTVSEPRAKEAGRSSVRSGRVDYTRLSDEQILEM